MDAFFQRPAGGGSCGYDWLLISRQMKPSVQRHLKMVYLTLCSSLVASAVGVYLHILFNVGGIITMLGCFLSIKILMYMSPCEKRKRLGFLMVAAVLEGASIGPHFEFILDFDPRIILIEFVGTPLAFACFSGAAMVIKRKEYLGGLLSARSSYISLLRISSLIFGPSAVMFNFELYLRLLFVPVYIVFDTQKIIERAHHGDLDYVKHAFTLLTDFIYFLVDVLIMTKNFGEKKGRARGIKCHKCDGVSKHIYEKLLKLEKNVSIPTNCMPVCDT